MIQKGNFMNENIFTHYADMPTTIKSFVVYNEDMSFTIIINSKIGKHQQLLAYQHEISHIRNGDYYKGGSVDAIESYAHRYKE